MPCKSFENVELDYCHIVLTKLYVNCYRYNLGITCVNLAAYREAAEHLLTALNQQAAGRGVQGQRSWSAMSDSIWSTLRLVMSLLDRQDLYDALDNR